MPALTGRIDRIFSKEIAGDRAPNGAAVEIKKLYFDVATGTNEAALNALLAVAPISQILFGTDYPFVKVAETTDGLDGFKLPQSDLQAINRDNALRLFPHLQAEGRRSFRDLPADATFAFGLRWERRRTQHLVSMQPSVPGCAVRLARNRSRV